MYVYVVVSSEIYNWNIEGVYSLENEADDKANQLMKEIDTNPDNWTEETSAFGDWTRWRCKTSRDCITVEKHKPQ